MPQELTQWLPDLFDADALAGMPDGVSADVLLPDDGDAALDAWVDAYAVAVANDDAEGAAALRAMMAEASVSLSHSPELLAEALALATADGDTEAVAELAEGWEYEAWRAAPLPDDPPELLR